jgi:hypothetical protein
VNVHRVQNDGGFTPICGRSSGRLLAWVLSFMHRDVGVRRGERSPRGDPVHNADLVLFLGQSDRNASSRK